MPEQVNIALKNTTSSGNVFVYITGRRNDAVCVIQADGKTPYFPPSPGGTLHPLDVDCGIRLGAPGTTVTATIPQISAARIWFSIDKPLTFFVNPGPALVEPAAANASDANNNTMWGFCEFTFNSSQLFANISYVDFVSIPVAMSLTNTSGKTQTVQGLPKNGLDIVCNGLVAQQVADGAGWDRLIIKSPGGQTLRALSPVLGMVQQPSLFSGYFEPYVDLCWNAHTTTPVTIDTQSGFGTVQGTVSGGLLNFPGLGSFAKPTTEQIFKCDHGPFITNPSSMAALTPRVCAALNRSTLHGQLNEPANSSTYYMYPKTNHYSRIVHAANLDRRGYAFPYDDVAPSGGLDQSGSVFDPNPSLLTIVIGGGAPAVIDATSTIRAENFTSSKGVNTEPCKDTSGGRDVGWIANGDWIAFDNVDFHGGMTKFTARVASGAASGVSGLVQVALDSPIAVPVGSFSVSNTGGWQSWITSSATISKVSGTHTLYLTFASGKPDDFVNVNWFSFSANGADHPVIDATSRIRAETFDSNQGVKTEPTSDEGGGNDVGYISTGDWVGYNNVDFHGGMAQITARVASGAPQGVSGLVQVALDSPTATPVGSFSIGNTGGWQSWTTVSADISPIAGIHTLYLTFASTRPEEFVNINWFTFAAHGVLDAASRIRAENFDTSQGVKIEPTSDEGGGNDVGYIGNGDWIGFNNVNFHDGMIQFTARVASGAPQGDSGLVQVALDSPTAKPVGSFSITNTGGWQNWTTVSTDISKITGIHTLYLTFASGRPEEFVNVNWFQFSTTPIPPQPQPPQPQPPQPKPPIIPPTNGKYKSVVYFPNYVIYARGFMPADLPANMMTHINYSFADVKPDTGEIVWSDSYADTDKHYPGDSWNDVGTNVYGNVKQLFLLKKQFRNLKVLLSVGGWGYKEHFASPLSSAQGRTTFVQSAVSFVKNMGFDGIDIDWEFPANPGQAQNFVDLLKELRAGLDAYSSQAAGGYRFLISVAVSAGPSNYQVLHVKDMDQYLDFWNLMSYDMAGSWDSVSGHQANIYKSASNPASTQFSADQAITYYTTVGGVNPQKICLGMPIYGRAFLNTDGPGKPYNGIGYADYSSGSWEAGVWDYKALPRPGATENYDPNLIASWSYDSAQRMMVTYDTPEAEIHKSDYIIQKGLGGAMWWEASADKKGGQSLIWNVANRLTNGNISALEGSANLLDYPQSKYDNLKNKFPGS